MVVVATIALATMVSNHVVLPLWLSVTPRGATVSGDIRNIVLLARRVSIAVVLGLGYVYHRLSGGGAALASIGLISFVGIVQIGPPLLAGVYWRGATRAGAAAGLTVGFVIWTWCLLLPSVGAAGVLPDHVLANGPFGWAWLRPQALFGAQSMDPMLQAATWSIGLNALVLVLVSLMTRQSPLERLLAAQFTMPLDQLGPSLRRSATATAEDLMIMSQRVIGSFEAQQLFDDEAKTQGRAGQMPDVTPDLLEKLERKMAGSVGAATAHAMVGQMSGDAGISVEDLLAVADEAAQILEYSNRLEIKSQEQERTEQALRDANRKLLALGLQKDAFLSQISHELRTPMTSVRSFSDLLTERDIDDVDRVKFASIIQAEATRLTRLLDDLLDLSVLESGHVTLSNGAGPVGRAFGSGANGRGGRFGRFADRAPRKP